MRVIIRLSLEKDNGDLNSALCTVFKRHHFTRGPGTGIYEASSDDMNVDSLKGVLDEFWDKITRQHKAGLDHFWMYVDNGPLKIQEKRKRASARKSS